MNNIEGWAKLSRKSDNKMHHISAIYEKSNKYYKILHIKKTRRKNHVL